MISENQADPLLVFIILPLCGVGIVAFVLPETKGLALEEIGALFGDEVALDISHLTLEERMALDRSLTKAGGEKSPTTESLDGRADQVEVTKDVV